jgi:subtilisin family serine protease
MLQGRASRATALAILCAGFAFAANATEKGPKVYPAVPGQFIVKMKSTISAMSTRMLGHELNGDVIEKLSRDSGAYLIQRPAVETANYSLSQLNQASGVEYAEPNYIYKIVGGVAGAPNDPQLGQLWGMSNNGGITNGDGGSIQGVAGIDIDALKAWMIETGTRDFKIAVIDTGIGYGIDDLKQNVWTNQVELNGKPGVDDDVNGCVDDIHGCNFVANNGDPLDDHGHGSHVSGTIAGIGNNGIGVVGVAWQAQLVAVKFLDAQGGGTLANAIKGIDYARAVGVRVMSNSWGGGAFSQNLYDVISRAKDAGILFIAAAGNDGTDNDTTPSYPASYALDNIISVAAVDASGALADFSCYGKNTVHIAAPGVNITSITPTGFQSWSGTSMATPHVSGVAALLISQHPEQTYADIKRRILSGARPLASLRGKTLTAGMLNAFYALTDTQAPADPQDPFYWTRSAQTVSTEHPYQNNTKASWTFSVPGAARIAIHFRKFETEKNFDNVVFKDKTGVVLGKMSGVKGDTMSPVFDGDTVTMEFASDNTVNAYGFDVADIAYQSATTKPAIIGSN